MQLLERTWLYFVEHQPEFWAKTGVHLRLSATALLAGLIVGVLLGVLAARSRTAAPLITQVAGALRSIPSLAIMAAMLPLIGVGFRPALIALTILAIPPILINTLAGFGGVNPAVIEAARGMGMSPWQVAWLVQTPLALPVIVAGFRTAAVEVLASATIGAIIGAGGLGEYVFAGLSLGPAYIHLMLVGAITIALITLGAETALGVAERVLYNRYYHPHAAAGK
jgi:osmoprotectant transport system permease protein